ncbi:MAG: hypothetical protein OEV42_06310 [Deltaproteobacteria bacterium]|nr:hypothetical protein [Deltaproteobacteria bacterium]
MKIVVTAKALCPTYAMAAELMSFPGIVTVSLIFFASSALAR